MVSDGQLYAEKCNAVNRRLGDAALFLRSKFRSEAIRICEMEPNLVDEIQILNFPERAAWVGIATPLGVSTPDLYFDLAVEVNDAYDGHLAQEALVNEYRKLNTLRAPAAEREEALKKLSAAEPYNEVWKENLTRLKSV